MDACLMAAQLAINCGSPESKPVTLAPPTTDSIMVPKATLVLSSPTKTTITPEVNQRNFTRSEPVVSNPSTMAVQSSRLQSFSPSPGRPDRMSPSQVSRMAAPQAMGQPFWATYARPQNGGQMYQFRLASLRSGQLFTRVSPQRYQQDWQQPSANPTHQDWRALLKQEAAVLARAQGGNRLSIVVGDSLGLWLPAEPLPRDRFWLNQSISGETTTQMLSRLHYFSQTRPQTIHIMAGINDLKNGASDFQVLDNFQRMLNYLHQQHPQAEIVVYSILPTRWNNLPSHRIRHLNRTLGHLARYQGARFVDLQPSFADGQGQLRRELTTDGLHLTIAGYDLWRTALISYSR